MSNNNFHYFQFFQEFNVLLNIFLHTLISQLIFIKNMLISKYSNQLQLLKNLEFFQDHLS